MRLGELCAGYGGLGMAVEEVFGATTAWFSEYDAAPSRILAHHWPDVPNHGDMTKIDWANIEHVDIISGGTPCQDLSAAGRRAGMTEGTRSNLWVQMREAIATQRPRYVVWENVRGAYSATAASDLEQCPGCMGDTGNGGTVLRALGRVLGDLSDLGYDTQWRGLRAADVGACHGRFRVFVLAQDRDGGRGRWGSAVPSYGETSRADSSTHGTDYRPGGTRTPAATAHENVADAYSLGYERGGEARGRRPGSADSGKPAAGHGGGQAVQHPRSDAGSAEHRHELGQNDGAGKSGEGTTRTTNWGEYAPSVRRWEAVMGRRSPSPTEPTGRNGGHRLSPRFTEWMMGLPDGWVTDPAIGISRNDQLKACGNGVVPQQAIAALRDMLHAPSIATQAMHERTNGRTDEEPSPNASLGF